MPGARSRQLICDAMLGHLARDLRLLGYDVAYDAAMDDDALLVAVHAGERLLITKDKRLAERAGERGLLVRASEPTSELREVVDALGLAPSAAAFLTRCTACGGALESVPAASVALPPGVAERHERVSRCRACGHLYWDGTHVGAIRRRLGGYFAPEGGARDGPER